MLGWHTPPRKLKAKMIKMTMDNPHEWRCISYRRWGIFHVHVTFTLPTIASLMGKSHIPWLVQNFPNNPVELFFSYPPPKMTTYFPTNVWGEILCLWSYQIWSHGQWVFNISCHMFKGWKLKVTPPTSPPHQKYGLARTMIVNIWIRPYFSRFLWHLALPKSLGELHITFFGEVFQALVVFATGNFPGNWKMKSISHCIRWHTSGW